MYLKGSAFPGLWSRPSESHITWKTLHVSESHEPCYAGLCLKEQTVLQLRVCLFSWLAEDVPSWRNARYLSAHVITPHFLASFSYVTLYRRSLKKSRTLSKKKAGHWEIPLLEGGSHSVLCVTVSRRPLQDLQRCFFHICDITKKMWKNKTGGALVSLMRTE